MSHFIYILTITSLIICILAGCNSNTETHDTTTNITLNHDISSEDIIEIAKQNLSQSAGIESEHINVLYLRAVNWPDSSLGCPEEGMEYTQVVTSGYQILLEAYGTVYEYHTDMAELMVICAEAQQDDVKIPDQDAVFEDGTPNQPIENYVIITKTIEKR